jgi:hypothetical protein
MTSRVLAEGASQGVREPLGIDRDLSLIDEGMMVRCRYSIGSSTVMMCAARVALM